MLSPAEIATHIGDAWGAHLLRANRAPTPHDYVYASAWRVCDRRMVYELRGEAAAPWTPEVLAKFRRGDDRERDLLADLTRIGRDAEPSFGIIGQQERFALKDRRGRVAIVGKVDARLDLDGRKAPIEVKAWSPFMTDKIDSFDQLFANPWTRSGGYQLLAYLYGAGEPYGFLLLDRSGIPRLLPVELDRHLDRMEEFLTRAERVLDAHAAGTLPEFLADDPAECQRCPFYGGTCNPPLAALNPMAIIADPELEAVLSRREALADAADEYDRIDREVKRKLRGVEHGLVGPFAVRGTWGKSSRVELPADLKAQYTVTDPKGRFTLDIVRLQPATVTP
jgi:hypothetical protein